MNQALHEYDFTDLAQPVGLGNNFWLDDKRLSRAFCHAIPGRMADLLEVAMSVYTADRRSLRHYVGASTGHRRIRIHVAVRDREFWGQHEIYRRLEDYLCWISEDEWTISFVQRNAPLSIAESEQFLFSLPPEKPARVSLFSGGLDSLAGLAHHAKDDPVVSYVLVSGYTHDRLAFQQRQQASLIRSVWRNSLAPRRTPEISHIAVPFGIDSRGRSTREEKSQRTRAFVFLALGAATALQAQTETLWVYENGVGAMNLPLNAAQLGVDNYRGVHPRSLILAEGLFQLVLEQPIRIQNRSLFHTKVEMCSTLADTGLAEVVSETVSCDSYPMRVPEKTHCGRCTSCILRRQALHCSGLVSHDQLQDYQYDVLSNGDTLDLDTVFGLEVMRSQVQKLRRLLSADDSWRELVSSYPEVARAAAQIAVQSGLDINRVASEFVRLYRTYVDEWDSFPVTSTRAA